MCQPFIQKTILKCLNHLTLLEDPFTTITYRLLNQNLLLKVLIIAINYVRNEQLIIIVFFLLLLFSK